MDIAAVLIRIRPGAAWRMSDTYENLAATWEDTEQSLPTEQELQVAWAEMQAEADTPQIVTPPVNQDIADLWEAVFAITAEKEGGKITWLLC